MKLLLKLSLFTFTMLLSGNGLAQSCTGGQCQSQLLRVDVDNVAVNDVLRSKQQLQELALPAINNFLQSELFSASFLKDYPMEPMGFPFNGDLCKSEKAEGDAKFRNIDCTDLMLCSDPNVSDDVKDEICFKFPCALFMGPQRMGQCADQGVAVPSRVHFPQPVGLKKLTMVPTGLTTDNNTLRACFNITQMEISASAEIEFMQDPNVTYERLGIRNLNSRLDRPREVCMSAVVDLSADNPVSQIRIEKQDGDFVSNEMVDQALISAEVYGLSGYSPSTVNVLKRTALPPIVRHLRPLVESAVQISLAQEFETQITTMLSGMRHREGPVSLQTGSNSFVSELGVANTVVTRYADLMDCALMKSARTVIPPAHKCFNQLYNFKNSNLRLSDIPTPAAVANILRTEMGRYDGVTSESLRVRLANFQTVLNGLGQNALYNSHIAPLVAQIANNQVRSQLLNNVNIMTGLGGRLSSNFGVSLPEICDVTNPSPLSGRSIPNCPVQAYVDLHEMNNLLTEMYRTGRLCHSGRGDFVPPARGAARYNNDGSPRGSGCLFRIEEQENGMRCFLDGAPQLRYDSATRGYRVSMKTKECYRGEVFLGQGKIGGDINFDIGFTPSVCDGGDFCLENGQAAWNVTPGTARFALRDSSWLNGIVRSTIDSKLNEIIGQTIRLPLSSATGPMSLVPLEAEGRIDAGEGYFGACLKIK